MTLKHWTVARVTGEVFNLIEFKSILNSITGKLSSMIGITWYVNGFFKYKFDEI